MRNYRPALVAMLAVLVIAPFAVPANAQVSVGIGIGGPAVVPYPAYYGPPDCAWGYYNYYPYACAPYGYYGPSWFAGGVFIGAGPWYGLGRRAYAYPGYGYRGGYVAPRYYGGYNGGYVAPRYYGGDRDRDRAWAGGNRGNYGGGYAGGGNRTYSAPSRGFNGNPGAGARGGFSGGSRGFSGGSRGFAGGGGNGGARGGGRR